MSLVDGPTGQELAREELADPIYAEAQPSLIERIIEWLLETVTELLNRAEGAPGGSWVLVIAATAGLVGGIWLIARWRTSPGRSKGEIFEDSDKRSTVDYLAEAQARLASGDWGDALVAATRAIVQDLQAASRVVTGPGITIADVRKAVPDPTLAQTLTTFERVQYGGGSCHPEQARAALALAVEGVREATARGERPRMTLTPAAVSREESSPNRQPASRRVGLWVGIVVVIGLCVAGVVALTDSGNTRTLDPRSPAPGGSLAIANLLADRGVEVQQVGTLSEATSTPETATLVVINSSLIGPSAGEELLQTNAARLIIVGATGGARPDWVTESFEGLTQTLPASCDVAEARAAGSATFAGQMTTDAGVGCFPSEEGFGLAQQDTTTVLADGIPLMNSDLAEAGNAALALNLMSATDAVTWYLPSPNDTQLAPGRQSGLNELLPSWTGLLLLQALLLFLVLIIWRGRRLGPLVREDLPIVVPAHETDQGFASLLQRNSDAAFAAQPLREASVARIAETCGLPRSASADIVAGALAQRLAEPQEPIAAVLYRQSISSGADLADLRQQLAELERRARHP